jgi:hypothetical protein
VSYTRAPGSVVTVAGNEEGWGLVVRLERSPRLVVMMPAGEALVYGIFGLPHNYLGRTFQNVGYTVCVRL